MNRTVKLKRVYLDDGVIVLSQNTARKERFLTSDKFKLEMSGIQWLVVTAPCGSKTWIPFHNIKSIIEDTDEKHDDGSKNSKTDTGGVCTKKC